MTEISAEHAKLLRRITKARTVAAPENSVGQWIGGCLWHGVHSIFQDVLLSQPAISKLIELKPQPGDKLVKLPDEDDNLVQIDHAFFKHGAASIIAESKWLKDKRHLNDKGSWLKQMSEVARVNNVNHVMLVLAGPWSHYEERMIRRGFNVVITSVEQVYGALKDYGVTITIDLEHQAYLDPSKTLNSLLDAIEALSYIEQEPEALIGKAMLGPQENDVRKLTESLLTQI